ncbi:MAG: ASCH domain-containing protein [Methanobrevibacter sp.]|nr:ASCH domain-containing protein [Methanobrevibacter sp.]
MKTETQNISKVNELKFDIKWKEAIRDKVKTSTIRERFTGSPGDEFDIMYLADEFSHIDGTLRIKHVQRIRFDEIDRKKAKTEGYLHESLSKNELLNYYPYLEDSNLLYYIVFELLERKMVI